MGKILIYENGQQIEVDEELVKIYEPPFWRKEDKNEKGSDNSSQS